MNREHDVKLTMLLELKAKEIVQRNPTAHLEPSIIESSIKRGKI